MDQPLKQRLTGTAIVVSLIVIFVPLFFDDKDQQGSKGSAPEMAELPATLEERPMEIPRSGADTAETEKTDAVTGSGAYRIIPLNDPPPKPSARSNPAGGREMPTPEAGADEDFTIVDEGANRAQEIPPSKPASKKTQVYPLEPREFGQPVAPARSKPVYPAEPPPVSKAPPTARPPVVAETARAPAGEGSWMIQAGSFTGEANARNLVDKLRKSNFPAFVEVIPGESGTTMYRVRVGPELNKTRAEQVRARIESAVGIKGIIIPNQ